jgi:enolase
MARETIVSRFNLKGREVLSSYAAYTIEGVMTARVKKGRDSWTIKERNGIAKGTSDGENEAIYIPNDKAIRSMEKNIAPLLPGRVIIKKPRDILNAVEAFDLKLIERAGPNKRKWGGNACLASSTVFFQTLLNASGYEPWQLLAPRGMKTFYMPNIAFNMVCGGEHVPGTKQDIQEMFFFAMGEKSVKGVFSTATRFFKQFEKNLVRDGLPTGTAKERGFVFPVKDNYEGLSRIKECARQLGLKTKDYAIGTDNAFSEIQKSEKLRAEGKYDMRFSGLGLKTREELIEFNASIVKSASNFITMEDPGSEHDIDAHRLMNEKYGHRVQLVIDDAAVTQMRFILPFLAPALQKDRAGNSVLIKLNQAGTFTETCLATEIVLGLAGAERVERFLVARKDLKRVLRDLKELGVKDLEEALKNIKALGATAFFSHRSTEGSSEFLPYMPLIYGSVSNKIWFKAGAPNGERNLQNYNPLIRAEEEMRAAGIRTVVTNFSGLPDCVKIPGIQ